MPAAADAAAPTPEVRGLAGPVQGRAPRASGASPDPSPLPADPPRDIPVAADRGAQRERLRGIGAAKGNPGMPTELPDDPNAAGADSATPGAASPDGGASPDGAASPSVAAVGAAAATASFAPIADPQGHVPIPPGHVEPVTFAERVDALRAELDALGGEVARKRPWWREVTTLVAVAALVFSFGTTIVSYVRTSEQDVHDSAVELRTLVERLTQIPADILEANKTYADDPVTASTLASIYTQEEVLDAQQAAQIMDRIPDQVTPPEYSLVANILIGAGIDHPSLEMLDLGGEGRQQRERFRVGCPDEGDPRLPPGRLGDRPDALPVGARRVHEELREQPRGVPRLHEHADTGRLGAIRAGDPRLRTGDAALRPCAGPDGRVRPDRF